MSKLVLHMDKFKREAVRGLQSHNQRERKSHSNPDIAYERSGLNYDLHNIGRIDFTEAVDRRVDALKLPRSPRHDAVMLCGLIVSSDQEFFKGLGEARTREFFATAKEFLDRFAGPDNVISAVVHMDETTPHLHFMHVPVTKDGRLSAKDVYSRTEKTLARLQEELPLYLQGRGFNIERGVEQKPGAAKVHLKTREFKEQQEAMKHLQGEVAAESANLREVRESIRHGDETWKAKLRPAALTPDIDRSLSLKESILKLAPILCRMKKRGFTTAEVVEALKKHGLHIKGATLNRYLAEYQAGKSANTFCIPENRNATERTDQGVTNSYTLENQEAVTTERPRNIAPQADELPELPHKEVGGETET